MDNYKPMTTDLQRNIYTQINVAYNRQMSWKTEELNKAVRRSSPWNFQVFLNHYNSTALDSLHRTRREMDNMITHFMDQVLVKPCPKPWYALNSSHQPKDVWSTNYESAN